MKQFLISFVLITLTIPAISQIQFGLKAGLHSVDLVTDGIVIPNDDGQGIEFNFSNTKYGFHFGLYTRLSLLGIYIEPAFLLNSTSIDYSFREIGNNGVINTIKNETYNKFDIPVMIGLKGGFIRFYGGPVAHLHINSSSDLIDFPGYEQRFENASYGYQVGLGLDIWKLRFDVAYEGNLSLFGDHITIDGQNFSFDDSASRILFTAGLKF